MEVDGQLRFHIISYMSLFIFASPFCLTFPFHPQFAQLLVSGMFLPCHVVQVMVFHKYSTSCAKFGVRDNCIL